MGPRPKARKNSIICPILTSKRCFNGAAPEGAEEPGEHSPVPAWGVASMGPRPKARKNS